ncbi:sigma E protease regulator RseP [Gallibacterium sp. AGMB14963]|uniref:sigma E protease regulator RseP n=1 Tax=Gallibacterium faecale TaxID=3019086 RepID=UPI0022F1A54D|nr:sigma E protease regulator RseP [Gallibacterium sp. AGMB14963]MDA3979140.1 sigma E protease regulator RseP [Gallibacterium sp. AGMB14963]
MFSFLWTVASFIIVIAVLVFVHELGHFWVARRCGVAVQRFSIGFGKVLWRKVDKQGTEFVVSMIPLGGYVRMLDERNEDVPPELLAKAFNRQPVRSRIMIYAAGPLANFIFALLAFWVVYLLGIPTLKPIIADLRQNSLAAQAALPTNYQITAIDNEPIHNWEDVNLVLAAKMGDGEVAFRLQDTDSDKTTQRTIDLSNWKFDPSNETAFTSLGIEPKRAKVDNTIAKVSENSPAEKSGLIAGDKIVAVDGQKVDWQQFVTQIQKHPKQAMAITIERNGEQQIISLTPALNDKGKPYVGLVPVVHSLNPQDIEMQRYGLLSAFSHSWQMVGQLSWATIKIIGKLFTGEVSLNSLGGPISIAQGAGISSENGLTYFLRFMALISVNLGIMNLFPLPVLDGGQLVFLFIEGLTKKPVPEKIQNMAYRLGVALLLWLTVFVLFNDIMRL